MDAEDDDRPTGRDELATRGEAGLGPRSFDDDVVHPVGADARAEALAGLLLIRVAGLERNRRRAQAAGAGHGQQAERARADDRDTRAGAGPREPERMPGDRGRLHQGRIAHVEPLRQSDQSRCRRTELLRHAPVGTDAKRSLAVRRTQVVGAARALRAFHAAVNGLDDDGRAVLAHTGQLVTEDGAAPEPDVAQIGSADARRPHVEQLTDSGRLVELDDRHSPLHTADSLHAPPRRSARGVATGPGRTGCCR